MNLVGLLQQAVQAHPDRPCVMSKQDGTYRSWTYAAFWERVMAFAAGLRKCGVCRGDKVAILATNCPEWAIADYAILAIGAVVLPIYPTLPADQVSFILQNGEASSILVENQDQFDKVLTDWPANIHLGIVMHPETMRPAASRRRWIGFEEIEVLGHEPFSVHPVDPSDVADTEIATIVHTSGTSGQPKGVMLTHQNIVSNVQAALQLLPVEAGDTLLSYLPLSHIFERTVGQFAAMSAGGTVAYAESIEALPANLLEVRPTVLITVPRLLEKVYAKVMTGVDAAPRPLQTLIRKGLQQEQPTGFTYRLVDRLVYRKLRAGLGGRTRLIVSGGAALNADIAKFYIRAGIPVHEGYGMTESSPVIAANPLHANRPGTVGTPLPGVEIQIAEDGELLVKGPNVMLGYYHQPEETAQTITDGWLHTGDIAELEDGYLRIVDRKKNILVLATGKNVAPAPVENALALSPYVAAAMLVGDGRQYVTCLVSPDFEALQPLAESCQLTGDPVTWLQDPVVRDTFAREIVRWTADFATFERPKRAVLLPETLTVETGGLTPTLKVRARVITARYGPQIEAMYAGTEYLPIPLGPDGTEADRSQTGVVSGAAISGTAVADASVPAAPVQPAEAASKAARHPWRRRLAWTGVAVVVLAAAFVSLGGRGLPHSLDVVGMVRGIHNTNAQINTENGHIVRTLQDISNLAGKTTQIDDGLKQVQTGTVADDAQLGKLNLLSQQEIALSQQFLSLAQQLHHDLSTIGDASSRQESSLQQMNAVARQLQQEADDLAAQNQSITQKLQQADAKTRTVQSEMP